MMASLIKCMVYEVRFGFIVLPLHICIIRVIFCYLNVIFLTTMPNSPDRPQVVLVQNCVIICPDTVWEYILCIAKNNPSLQAFRYH